MPFQHFHPCVIKWFQQQFDTPSDVQKLAWPSIKKGQHTLLAAPTGSGKTLAAFLAVIDDLLQEGIRFGLPNETWIVYVSPLKALSNDIQKNLQQPLMGIRDELLMQGLPDVEIRASVRTGDTPASERERMRRKAPHILVTTPESLFILLTSKSGRKMLRTVRTVILDEIHALAGNKRGAHLTLSLERLQDLSRYPLTRIGISATQKPIETMARYLIGDRKQDCEIIDTGHIRDRDLAIEVPSSPLEALMSNEVWEEVYDRLAGLCTQHSTTLIFVNTRRLAERASKHLAERLGEDQVTSHHGSLAKEHRLDAENRLKSGQLKALVATASLELGIDIGDIDLVCQLGSPGSIANFLQRVGRSGHALNETPKGRLFPLTRDDLVEAAAILDAVRRGELDQICIPPAPLDILAQQIVAEVAGEEWSENKLFRLFKRAWPYRDLSDKDFDGVVRMLSEGYSTRRGRRGTYIHRDRVNQRLRDRRGARLVAMTNSGAIPDLFDYEVVLSPQGFDIGSLNEDFAFESLPGDIFQLGNTSYRILKIEPGKVYVEDAHGMPPNIPFWFGEAPGRSDALSFAVSRLRKDVSEQLNHGEQWTADWLMRTIRPGSVSAAQQLANYLWVAKTSINVLPTQKQIVLERFFDETGDMHLVVHSSFGSRINRAWGLALRKRFCRKFNFELQAAALEDSIILSLGATHSFALDEVAHYLHSNTVRHLLIQALLDAPMFETHWRWCATIALAIQRNRNGKKVPAQFQRNDAEDLVAQIFPDQIACFENIAGEREVPDHPLVNQTLYDCLHEVMDIDGLESVLQGIESGKIDVISRDLTTPSVLAQEILNARPFAFLDDAPAEERRTLAVKSRRYVDDADVQDLSQLDPAAIGKVREEAWPLIRNAEELHDALLLHGFLREEEAFRGVSTNPDGSYTDRNAEQWMASLAAQSRATSVLINSDLCLWVAAERLQEIKHIHPDAELNPSIPDLAIPDTHDCLQELIRGRLQALGPVTIDQIARDLAISRNEIQAAMMALEKEGYAIRGSFESEREQWCERGLLARINRYSLKAMRKRVEAVPVKHYMRFLFDWHGTGENQSSGLDAVSRALYLISGYPLNINALTEAMHTRIVDFSLADLDTLCASGRFIWFHPKTSGKSGNPGSLSKTTIVLVPREELVYWKRAGLIQQSEDCELSSSAEAVFDYLAHHGASFFSDIVEHCKQLQTQTEAALSELVSNGLVHSDSLAGLRALATPPSKRPSLSRFSKRSRSAIPTVEDAGRWGIVEVSSQSPAGQAPTKVIGVVRGSEASLRLRLDYDTLEYFLSLYFNRYGLVFKRLIEREINIVPWRDLLPVLQKLEARGDIRGGRFVDGLSGVQFALPEAAAALRKKPGVSEKQPLVSISTADPLNLSGLILPGKRLAASASNRMMFRDGELLASQIGEDIHYAGDPDEQTRWDIQARIKRTVKIAGKRFRSSP